MKKLLAAAKSNEEGDDVVGTISLDEVMILYQLSDKGLASELTAKGLAYCCYRRSVNRSI
jgi:hypothetical protein